MLAAAVFGAATVRGFSGFGDALVFLPFASMVLPPVQAVMLFVVIAAPGPIMLIPKAWRDVDKSLIIPTLIALLLFLPLGFWILIQIPPETFKLSLSIFAIAVVFSMVLGFKPNINLTPKGAIILGAFGGLIGGFTGVPGAILIFVLLNSQLKPAQIRAFSLIFLFVFDALMFLMGTINGDITLPLFITALILLPIYMAGSWLGQHIFNPEKERLFRAVALAAILITGLMGLPVFDGLHG